MSLTNLIYIEPSPSFFRDEPKPSYFIEFWPSSSNKHNLSISIINNINEYYFHFTTKYVHNFKCYLRIILRNVSAVVDVALRLACLFFYQFDRAAEENSCSLYFIQFWQYYLKNWQHNWEKSEMNSKKKIIACWAFESKI